MYALKTGVSVQGLNWHLGQDLCSAYLPGELDTATSNNWNSFIDVSYSEKQPKQMSAAVLAPRPYLTSHFLKTVTKNSYNHQVCVISWMIPHSPLLLFSLRGSYNVHLKKTA